MYDYQARKFRDENDRAACLFMEHKDYFATTTCLSEAKRSTQATKTVEYALFLVILHVHIAAMI